jgi:hypothetical protein
VASTGRANPVWSRSASALRARPPVWAHSIHAPGDETLYPRRDRDSDVGSKWKDSSSGHCCALCPGKAIDLVVGEEARSASGLQVTAPRRRSTRCAARPSRRGRGERDPASVGSHSAWREHAPEGAGSRCDSREPRQEHVGRGAGGSGLWADAPRSRGLGVRVAVSPPKSTVVSSVKTKRLPFFPCRIGLLDWTTW